MKCPVCEGFGCFEGENWNEFHCKKCKGTGKIKMILININECIACGQCMESCPQNAIIPIDTGGLYKRMQINQDKCRQCGQCIDVCPNDAIRGIEK